jgi:CRP/FNR family cyclic AMP-dependent transcriptional regulator
VIAVTVGAAGHGGASGGPPNSPDVEQAFALASCPQPACSYDACVDPISSGAEEGNFLAILDPESRAELRERGRLQRYRPGGMLLYEGQVDAPVVILLDGRVRVSALASDGRDLVLAFRGPGSILGELAALDYGRCSASVSAIDDVQVITLSPIQLHAFLRARPEAAIALLRLLSQRLRDADRKRIEFAALDTVGRVAARIVELANRFGEPQPDGSVIIAFGLSQEELATWVGSSREATVKALAQLRGLGWLDTARRRIHVNDLQALQHRSVP